ncbi:MAG: hypothetical protein OEY97_12830 [Nitrospirota bacterium]|nr:hypothetical protein [Nitrospirota bacterium]
MTQEEIYLKRLLTRFGQAPRGRYKTGTVAKVLGYSREWIRQRTNLPEDHPQHIVTYREGRDRFITHEELIRLISAESGC